MPFQKDQLNKFSWQKGWLWHHLDGYNVYKTGGIQMHRMHKQRGWIAWSLHMLHEVLEIWPLLTPNWKHLPCLTKKQLNWERFRVHLKLWINASQSPLVVAPNWCGEKCVAKALWNWKHKAWFLSWYNVSPLSMGQTLLKVLVMAKRWVTPKTHVIQSETWPLVIWKQS
jgi:hypothetical protein